MEKSNLLYSIRQRGTSYLAHLMFGCVVPGIMFGLYVKHVHEGTRRYVRLVRNALPFFGLVAVFVAFISAWGSGVSLPRLAVWCAALIVVSIGVWNLARWVHRALMLKQVSRLLTMRNSVATVTSRKWKDYPVREHVRASVEAARQGKKEFVLASLDMEGRAMCAFGEIPYFAPVSQKEFIVRDRYDIDIVLFDDVVLLRKNYRGDTSACLREWCNLEAMFGKANVPAVRMVDVEKTLLHMDCVFGRTMLDMEFSRDAAMHNRDIGQCTRYPEDFMLQLDSLLDAVHRCRLSDLDIRPANIVVGDDGKPWMIDFHEARVYPRWAEWIFRLKLDGDHLNYNRVFGRKKLTEATAREVLSEIEPWASQSPVDFGYGLTLGQFVDTAAGMGRWESFTAQGFPELAGKRIFLLNGCTGVSALLMLRSGARSVVAVEKNKHCFDAANALHRLFEWRDMRSYDFQQHCGDARTFASKDGISFDVLAASISLDHYYLKELQHMLKMATDKTSTVVVDMYRLGAVRNADAANAIIEKIVSLMCENGFPPVKTISSGKNSLLIIAEHTVRATTMSMRAA